MTVTIVIICLQLGPSVQNSGRLNSAGQPIPTSSSSSALAPNPHLSSSSSHQPSLLHASVAPIPARASGQSGLVNSQLLRASTGGGGNGGGGGVGAAAAAGGGDGDAGHRGRSEVVGARPNVYPDSSPEPKGQYRLGRKREGDRIHRSQRQYSLLMHSDNVSYPTGGRTQPVSHSTFPEVASETETISNVASLNDRIAILWDQPELADVTLIVGGTR